MHRFILHSNQSLTWFGLVGVDLFPHTIATDLEAPAERWVCDSLRGVNQHACICGGLPSAPQRKENQTAEQLQELLESHHREVHDPVPAAALGSQGRQGTQVCCYGPRARGFCGFLRCFRMFSTRVLHHIKEQGVQTRA